MESLAEFGLSEEESRVYLTLLELGGSFASVIAGRAKIPRVNTYYILEGLRHKGLVTVNLKGKVKFFVAEPPQVLVNQMEDKWLGAKKMLPSLLNLGKTSGFKPVIRSYEGLEGVKAILDQTLEAKSEVLGYTNLEALGALMPDYLKNYAEKLVKRGIKTRWLSPSTAQARQFIERFYPEGYPPELVEILFVNPNEFNFENQISIYDQRVAVLSLNPKEMIGLVIDSAVYAKTERAIFNLAWLGATSFVAQ